MLVKICGIRSAVSAKTAVYNGAGFLGFNFVSRSKRKISPEFAKQIIAEIKGQAKLVGVFQNQPADEVNRITGLLDLDFIQLHGNEDAEYIEGLIKPVIKAYQLESDFDVTGLLKNMNNIKAEFFLLDRMKQSQGKMLSIRKLAIIAKTHKIFVAGGLNAENVEEVIRQVKPYGVDVASGIESGGVEDVGKIKTFIERARNAKK